MYPDGTYYDGDWQNDKKHGQGTFAKFNGHKYTGEWKENQRHGEGTEQLPDETVFKATWVNGLKEGKGTVKPKDGEVSGVVFKEDKIAPIVKKEIPEDSIWCKDKLWLDVVLAGFIYAAAIAGGLLIGGVFGGVEEEGE